METSNIDKKKINESLNTLLTLFDESEAVLKGSVLPTNPIQKTEYNLEELVENIASGKISHHKDDSTKENNLISSNDEKQMAGLSLSQRLKAKLNASKAQGTNSEKTRAMASDNASFNKNNSSQGPSFASRLALTKQQRNIKNQNTPINIGAMNNSNQMGMPNNFDVSKASYRELHDYVMNCTYCSECSNRLNVLFGEGKLPSRLMVIGEGPGKYEDSTGRLFVGPSGDFLKTWLSSIHLDMREDVYLSNIVKCFSGTNPTPQRANYCRNFLDRQIDFVKPEAILILGKIAANSLLDNELPLNQMREKNLSFKGIPVVVTYHPAAVLRNEQWKRPVWNDLKQIASILNINLKRR